MVAVGKVLYGYCNGYFGDNYNDKRIEAFGDDWIVVRDIELGIPLFAGFSVRGERELSHLVEIWGVLEDDSYGYFEQKDFD